jgi:YbbR domain-containing protein
LTGTSDKLAQINPMDLTATVLVSDHTTGDRVVRLSADRVKIEHLPSGVQVNGFLPAVVSVRMEPKVESDVNVEIKFEGTVAAGYEVLAATANPARIKVRGPASHVKGIDKAPTESISLAGRKESFDVAEVAINIPDQKVDVAVSMVQVHVEIGERPLPKSLSGNRQLPSAGGEADKLN